MPFSDFGSRFRGNTGIASLMNDLATLPAIGEGELLCRLGGGNPAAIASVSERFRKALLALASDATAFGRLYGVYASPQGHAGFIDALVSLLNTRLGWSVEAENIALTNGSQNAFFMLFNLLAGQSGNEVKRILLPVAPEYIGYADVSIGAPIFTARQPDIELIGDKRFKYHLHAIDAIDSDIAAICLSRPTNPSGNVVIDKELEALSALADRNGIPLIVDNAYGAPFPDIIHVDTTLVWHPSMILCMSLSKIGLPAARTGIVIASREIIAALSEMNAVTNLASNSVTAGMLAPLVASGEILDIAHNEIRPWYADRVALASRLFDEAFDGLPVRMHQPEGAIFLWIWFENLPGGCQALYEALKARGVIVVAGHHFFPGLEGDWPHRRECLRVSIASSEEELTTGLERMATLAREIYATA
ncbi:MAG: valine--pyruvate transaminase [Gammaproteobacteria bacterium]|nr:MAG: valine--pyruvate transaminase [Gammaproteobacteria bacterium]